MVVVVSCTYYYVYSSYTMMRNHRTIGCETTRIDL